MWPRVISHSTGTVSDIATVYNRYGYLDEKREALEAWSAEISKLIDANQHHHAGPDRVIPAE
jgi:hypothetical protein